jgi:hypothetical protein
MPRKEKKPLLTARRALGVRLVVGKVPPAAYMIYEETWLDGDRLITKIGYGNRIVTAPGTFHLNAHSKKEKAEAKDELHPDLYTTIHAAVLLTREVEDRCLSLDRET